jgi:hypothetical protein
MPGGGLRLNFCNTECRPGRGPLEPTTKGKPITEKVILP